MTPARLAPPPTPEGILTREEVAELLKVKPRQVERLGVPHLDLGRKTKRYLLRDVLEWLEQRRADNPAGAQGRTVGTRETSDETVAQRRPWRASGGGVA